MADDSVTDPPETDPPPPPPPPPADDMPTWGKELKDSIHSLSETVNGLVAKGAEGVPVVEPIIPDDETPQTKPWTHRNPFGK